MKQASNPQKKFFLILPLSEASKQAKKIFFNLILIMSAERDSKQQTTQTCVRGIQCYYCAQIITIVIVTVFAIFITVQITANICYSYWETMKVSTKSVNNKTMTHRQTVPLRRGFGNVSMSPPGVVNAATQCRGI